MDAPSKADRQPMPDAIAPGLDLFAATWLEEWTRAGGYVISRPGGEGSFGYPVEPPMDDYPEPSAALPHEVRESSRTFANAHYAGKMRALMAMLDAMPHGRDALKMHMQSHAIMLYNGQPRTAQ